MVNTILLVFPDVFAFRLSVSALFGLVIIDKVCGNRNRYSNACIELELEVPMTINSVLSAFSSN